MGLTSGGSKDTKFQVKFNDEPEHITEDGFLRKHELWPNNGESRAHHTLGQMAEQFQEKARAAAKIGGGREIMLDEIDEEDDYEDADQELCLQGSESTGRWTKQEHELFLEALKKYGKVRI